MQKKFDVENDERYIFKPIEYNHIPSLRDGGARYDFDFYQHSVPDGTAGHGVISISTNILSLTGQRDLIIFCIFAIWIIN